MAAQDGRAHGVTPGLSRDYGRRTAERQAAFVLPYLRPGMHVLDIGCGPGSISLGLAQAVAPGRVSGIDHDWLHVEAARALAAERGAANVSFQAGDALCLPFEDSTFDAVFENNLFTHLSQDAVGAAMEAYRVLKPGGFLAARDVDADSAVWGHWTEPIKELDRLFMAWHQSRGSDIALGKRLPAILRQAGFSETIKSVSADTKGDPAGARSHADITISLLDGPFGRDVVDKGWADRRTVERLKESIREWGEHPDAFFANVHVEVIGWKTYLSTQIDKRLG
jgi:ubiquinone/menaquinone biosynthesis C-methylase UbiE